jgi:YspA, cpYpsA-related SLOG family
MIWIIAGGRDYDFNPDDIRWLDTLVQEHGKPTTVVHGGASGADAAAELWANAYGYPVQEFTAHWSHEGRAGGPIRNRRMATYARNHGGGICILFPGGKGTASMRQEAEKAGLRIIEREAQ